MKVEIWSDVVCPWCYLGKRRFETALAAFPHRDDVEIVWRSFELDPNAPRTREHTTTEHLAEKYGMSRQQAEAANARLTALAAEAGLTYHLDTARPGNSFDAHRLIHFAEAHGQGDAMEERLFRAYFTDNLPIGDRATLVGLAAEVGLDAAEARAMLESDAYADAVRADEQRARQFGINGVPFFAVDETYGVSGAQPEHTFSQVLEQVWAEEHSGAPAAAAGEDSGAA